MAADNDGKMLLLSHLTAHARRSRLITCRNAVTNARPPSAPPDPADHLNPPVRAHSAAPPNWPTTLRSNSSLSHAARGHWHVPSRWLKRVIQSRGHSRSTRAAPPGSSAPVSLPANAREADAPPGPRPDPLGQLRPLVMWQVLRQRTARCYEGQKPRRKPAKREGALAWRIPAPLQPSASLRHGRHRQQPRRVRMLTSRIGFALHACSKVKTGFSFS